MCCPCRGDGEWKCDEGRWKISFNKAELQKFLNSAAPTNQLSCHSQLLQYYGRGLLFNSTDQQPYIVDGTTQVLGGEDDLSASLSVGIN